MLWRYAKQEREIRVVVVDAEGDIFCAGADLRLAKEDSNVPKIEGADDISFSLRRLHKPANMQNSRLCLSWGTY